MHKKKEQNEIHTQAQPTNRNNNKLHILRRKMYKNTKSQIVTKMHRIRTLYEHIPLKGEHWWTHVNTPKTIDIPTFLTNQNKECSPVHKKTHEQQALMQHFWNHQNSPISIYTAYTKNKLKLSINAVKPTFAVNFNKKTHTHTSMNKWINEKYANNGIE